MESLHHPYHPSLMFLNNHNNNANYGSQNSIMQENMMKTEKCVKHYSSCQQILIVGDGDFSFSLSLALGFGSAFNICATSLDSYVSLINTYKKARINLMQLRMTGATVLHEVDARKMKHHPELYWRKFDCIVYNFPHAGFYGKEDNPDMINMHQGLVYDFFSNARCLLQHNGQIHVTHKTKPPYSSWNLEELACKNSLLLQECVPFDIKDYPFYENKRGHGSTIDEPFNWRDSYTFKFIAAPLPTQTFFNNYLSHFDLVSGFRETLPRVKFIVKAEVRLYPRAAGYAGVLVDENHSIRAKFLGPLTYMDVNVAELLAIKYALLMFERSDLCCRNVALDVESDSNFAVSWIQSKFRNHVELFADLQEITIALGRIQNHVEFYHIHRDYRNKHYREVYELALEAMDKPRMYESWLP